MGGFRPKEVLQQARQDEQSGRSKEAAEGFSQVASHLRRKGNWEEARLLLERSLALTPKAGRLYVGLAHCETHLMNSLKAEAHMRLFANYTLQRRKMDEYVAFVQEQLSDSLHLQIVYFEALLELDRTTAIPFLGLGDCWLQKGDFERARNCYLDALQTKTHDEKVLAALKQLANREDNQEALECIERFEAGKIQRAELSVLLSADNAMERRGPVTVNKNSPLLEQARSAEKGLSELIRELEKEMGVTAPVEDRDSVGPLVQEFRRRSATVLGTNSKLRIDMGLAFFEMGLIEDACDELGRIEDTDLYYHEAQCLLGEILYSEGSDMAAIEVFQRCLRDGKATEEIQREAKYRLLQIYIRLDDFKKAGQLCLELEKKYADYRQLRQLKSQIQSRIGPIREKT